MFALKQKGRFRAVQIGYMYEGNFLQLQEGYDPTFAKGAGNALRHLVIEYCINRKITTYDFLGGFSEHKRRWGASVRTGHDLLIGNPSMRANLLFLKEIWPNGRLMDELGLVTHQQSADLVR